MKNKKVVILIVVIIALILLFPIPMRLKDGGSLKFQALLYNVTFYNKLSHTTDNGYIKGIGIEILGVEIFNNTIVEEHTVTEERIKLSDLKIKVEDASAKELVKFNGNIYGKSFIVIDYAGDLNKSIGEIDFLIEEQYLPQLDGETNRKEFLGAKVLEVNDKSMILNVNNVAVAFTLIEKDNIRRTNGKLLFEKCGEDEENNVVNYNSFVGTVIEETTTYMIVEPNEDEIERKSADRIVINYGTDHHDYLYGKGRKVIIQYTGYIKETYPAQIDTDNILIFGYEDFEISVKKAEKVKKTKILNDMEIHKNNSDVNLYYYGLEEVNIKVDNKTMTLEEAIRSGRMTIDGLLVRANKDVSAGIIKSETYKDGGTTEWYYKDYTIIKKHSLDGNRDVYIGISEMRLNNL